MDSILRSIKERLVGAKCYLDGAPAKIVGRELRFAQVVTLDGDRSITWAWHSADNVMRYHGGFFETR